VAEGTYRLADPKQSRNSLDQQVQYMVFYMLVFIPGVWYSVSTEIHKYATVYLAWSHVGLFLTLVLSFASLDAVEDAQSRFRACSRRTLQAAQVNMAGQEVTFMRRNGERVTLQGTSGTRIHGWHLASCIEEVISQQEAADKKGQPAWFYHLCIMTVAVLHAMAPWVLTLAIETEQKQQLVHASQEVKLFVIVYSILDYALMSAVVLMVMKAISAYTMWRKRIHLMSCMTDKLTAAQTDVPFLDLSFPANLRTWRELRAYESQKVVYEDKIRQLEVPLGFLLVWQLGRLLLLVAMIVTEFMRRRDEDQYETLFLTQRDVSIAGVVFLDLCIFGILMSILIANGLTIYHEQKAQSVMLREKGVHMLEQELEQDEMLGVVRQHYQQYDTAGMNTMYNWGSGHLHEAAINQEKARLRQSAIMLQATASSLQVQQIPPTLST